MMQKPAVRDVSVAIAPGEPPPQIVVAVREGGGRVVPYEQAEGLVWTGRGPDGLKEVLDRGTDITWVQLPSAGVERYASIIDDRRAWTSAKGIYARPVAEHALALALAGMHALPQLVRAHTWRKTVCRSLQGASVTVVGGGGITQALLELLRPFGTTATVVRRHPEPLPGADRVVVTDELIDALRAADVVILALALTPETEHIVAEAELRAMKRDAWLVNVGRGKLIDTEALVTALRDGWIGGAALDVTDPEPLPDGHPLWMLENCVVTPHCANPPALEQKNYAALIRENVHLRALGEPLKGLIDPQLGY